jgi:hypothetical protein
MRGGPFTPFRGGEGSSQQGGDVHDLGGPKRTVQTVDLLLERGRGLAAGARGPQTHARGARTRSMTAAAASGNVIVASE